MQSKTPPEVLTPSEKAYMSGLNERDRRLFLAAKAEGLKAQGLSYRKFSTKMGISTHTLQTGCKNCIPATPLQRGASAERVADVMPVCPNTPNGFRPRLRS